MPERIQCEPDSLPPDTIFCGPGSFWENLFEGMESERHFYLWLKNGDIDVPKVETIARIRRLPVRWKAGTNLNLLGRDMRARFGELRGAKYLACTCPTNQPCHVDFIIQEMEESNG